MQAVQQNPNLPGLRQAEVVVLSEKLNLVNGPGFRFCAQRCITHFGDESIPYHPGEKTCLDRCEKKVYFGFEMARESRRDFEAVIRSGIMPYEWMKKVSEEKAAHS